MLQLQQKLDSNIAAASYHRSRSSADLVVMLHFVKGCLVPVEYKHKAMLQLQQHLDQAWCSIQSSAAAALPQYRQEQR